ncbi:MAG TPA: hypothetical protein VFX30_11240 [bacterium]|nr:hypothetical protein [bacterium]
MKLRTSLPFVALAFSLAACGATSGWPQVVKDTLIDTCVKEAKAGGAALEEGKIRTYCTCYQENVQKAYPDSGNLKNAKPEDLSKAAGPCLELVLK